MKCGSQIAVAVVGGYFLGRSRKTRLAALLALLAAGGKIPIDSELLRKTPLGAPLDKLTGDLRGQLVDAGMNVAKRAASSRIDSFSDKLQQRADVLRTPRPKGGAAAEDDEEPQTQERPRRQRRRDEPAREEPARRTRSRRAPEPEEAPDEYDDYDDYEDDDEYDDEQGERDDGGEYEYEDDEYEDEAEPEPEREEPRRPSRSARPEPRRRAPRRDDERLRRGRAAR
jgi:hypothetical protein